MQARILRIVDANINRVSEGLRVLEDISRFILEDQETTRNLKSVRHQINDLARNLGVRLLLSRDSAGDIGAGGDLMKEHSDLHSIIRANAKRAQEGLRVLEELTKLPGLKDAVTPDTIRQSRYLIYTVEANLISKLAEDERRRRPD